MTLTEKLKLRMESFKLSLDTSFNTLNEAGGRSDFLKSFCEFKKEGDRRGMFEWYSKNYDHTADIEKGDEHIKKLAEKVSYIFNPLNVTVTNDRSFELAEQNFEGINFIKFEQTFKKQLNERVITNLNVNIGLDKKSKSFNADVRRIESEIKKLGVHFTNEGGDSNTYNVNVGFGDGIGKDQTEIKAGYKFAEKLKKEGFYVETESLPN